MFRDDDDDDRIIVLLNSLLVGLLVLLVSVLAVCLFFLTFSHGQVVLSFPSSSPVSSFFNIIFLVLLDRTMTPRKSFCLKTGTIFMLD